MNYKFLLAVIFIILGIIFSTLALGLRLQHKAILTGDQETYRTDHGIMQQLNDNLSQVIIAGHKIEVELADTPAKRAQGLSDRDPLPEGQGMLFVFDQPGVYGFWMNRMKFNLDIIWLMDDKVVDIWPNAPAPAVGEEPAHYQPQTQANYVLEVTAGFVERTGLKAGDTVYVSTDLF